MKTWQVILLVAVLLMGVAAGLFYGWIVDPVTYVDTSADSLRIDYKTDIVLMIAEIYTQTGDLEGAIARLDWLAGGDRIRLVEESLGYARSMNFGDKDLQQISNLLDELHVVGEAQ